MRSIILVFCLFAMTAAEARILRPNPSDFTQVGGFSAEFCARPALSGIDLVCFGSARFLTQGGIRAILVRKGTAEGLYVEDEWKSVDLLKPRFGVVGPMLPSSAFPQELGVAQVSLNESGEVDSLAIETPSLGALRVTRSR